MEQLICEEMDPALLDWEDMLDFCNDDIIIFDVRTYSSTPIYPKKGADCLSMNLYQLMESNMDSLLWGYSEISDLPFNSEKSEKIRKLLKDCYFEKVDKSEWTESELAEWDRVLKQDLGVGYEEIDTAVLSLMTGNEWECGELRGYCQGDINPIYYNSSLISDEGLRFIESIWFGMGSEYYVYYEDEKDDGTCFYTDKHGDQAIEAISKEYGVPVEDIVLKNRQTRMVEVVGYETYKYGGGC